MMDKPEAPPRKRPTNVSLNLALLEEAKVLGVNVSKACERGLADEVAAARARKWLESNQAALSSLNRFVEENGLPRPHPRPC